jgi:hypothetical protein
MDHDMALLLDCFRMRPQEAKTARLSGFTQADWEQILTAAYQHRVVPILFHTLKPFFPDLDIPKDIRLKMRHAFYTSTARNMRLYRELSKAIALFNNRGIPVILLKGAHLAELVYDNIGLRGMCDVDLLVKKEDLMSVDHELLTLGSAPEARNLMIAQHNYSFGYKLPPSGLSLEVHWTLNSPGSTCRVDVGGLWSRAQSVTLAKDQAWALSAEDLLLHLCLHTAKHALVMDLRMLYDIGEVLRCYGASLDWTAVGARARQWSIQRAVYVFLRLAGELLGAAVPENRLAALHPDNFDEHYLELVQRHMFSSGEDSGPSMTTQSAAQFWGHKGLAGKIEMMRDRFRFSREIVSLKYPSLADSWRIRLVYYPLRLRDLMLWHGASLWRLANGDPKARAAAVHVNEITALREWLMSG